MLNNNSDLFYNIFMIFKKKLKNSLSHGKINDFGLKNEIFSKSHIYDLHVLKPLCTNFMLKNALLVHQNLLIIYDFQENCLLYLFILFVYFICLLYLFTLFV